MRIKTWILTFVTEADVVHRMTGTKLKASFKAIAPRELRSFALCRRLFLAFDSSAIGGLKNLHPKAKISAIFTENYR